MTSQNNMNATWIHKTGHGDHVNHTNKKESINPMRIQTYIHTKVQPMQSPLSYIKLYFNKGGPFEAFATPMP